MRRLAVAVCAVFFAVTLSAATFELPTDAQLLGHADIVVVATVLDSSSREADDRMIYTDSRLRVEEVLKGSAPETIVVTEAGGYANHRILAIAGSAKYEAGSRVLAFLRQTTVGTYYTGFMALGQYRLREVEGRLAAVRSADGIETISGDAFDVRDASAFLRAIRDGGVDWPQRMMVTSEALKELRPRSDAFAGDYVVTGGSPARPLRWNCNTAATCALKFDVGGSAQPGVSDTLGEIDNGMDLWNTAGNSYLSFSRGGATFSSSLETYNGVNEIFTNSTRKLPSAVAPGCDSALACGFVWATDTPHNWDGGAFNTVFEGDVQIGNQSLSSSVFRATVAHELGHAVAFRHGPGGSLMSPVINTPALGQWDKDAASEVYGPGAACAPVNIVGVSGGGNVPSGQSASLSVTATGDAPLSYQWYLGSSGVTSFPISGANGPNYTTGPITQTTQYWVKVSNGCPSSANSATITVTPQTCDAVSIITEPQSQTITTGNTATLGVVVSGTSPYTYRWYQADVVGDTSKPVGTNSPNFTTPALNATTRYWVRVTNGCGQDDSVLATITVVTQCVPASITTQPGTISVGLGNGASLFITANGTSPLSYQWYEGAAPDASKPVPGATGPGFSPGPFNIAGTYRYWVRVSNACNTSGAISQTITINVACPPIEDPEIYAPPATHYSQPYDVTWTGDTAVSPTFNLQEATDDAFTKNLKNFTVTGKSQRIQPHVEVTTETRFFYRVRPISACTSQPGAWSRTTTTIITPPLPQDTKELSVSVPEGSTQDFTQSLLIPGFGDTATNQDTFSITSDEPWITIFPASGALSAGGTTVQLTIHPGGVNVGSNTATLKIVRTNGASSGGVSTNVTAVTTTSPFSLSIVTPVTPKPRDGNPPPGTLIIPAVAHAQGIGSPFRSDVRIANVSFDDIEYEITYTPSRADGTQTGKMTKMKIKSGNTIALDDLVKAWFGAGVLDEGGIGTIEIRPLSGANPFGTFASSRTYALDAGGTLGQFIPALRLDQFIGNRNADTLNRISLQQVANSDSYRTNLGFVEGSGVPAQMLIKLLDGSNNVIRTAVRDVSALGQFQESLPSMFGNDVRLNDGRVEVEVTSPGGKVSAYASVLNNITNDPLMVFPVQPGRFTASRYVLAGIAEFDSGFSNFHSDMRIYNGGPSTVTATLTFYDRQQSTPRADAPPKQIILAPGQVSAINNVLPTLWPGLIAGGSVVVTAPADSSLVVTAQTYSRQADGGTKGQFIPGVTSREAVGLGDRAMQVLQLEQSAQYRSNVGFVEVTGKPVTIEVTAFDPAKKFAQSVPITLKANEYVQYGEMLKNNFLRDNVYNGRIAVRVISGDGRVYAYGSTIDNRTEDPTYVPGQ